MSQERKDYPSIERPMFVSISPYEEEILLRGNNAFSQEIVDRCVEKFSKDFQYGQSEKDRDGQLPQLIIVKRITPELFKTLSVPYLVPISGSIYVANNGHHRFRAASKAGVAIQAQVIRVIE